jgi:hypothetical protein
MLGTHYITLWSADQIPLEKQWTLRDTLLCTQICWEAHVRQLGGVLRRSESAAGPKDRHGAHEEGHRS